MNRAKDSLHKRMSHSNAEILCSRVMSAHAKKMSETQIRRCQSSQNFPNDDSTASGYGIEIVSFEESASQEQENICNQRGEKL
uniref:Uncharacterized protein n=1 Tax=Arundo donax TaxID=35708 RepID=A0A0A8XRW0_ARUDO